MPANYKDKDAVFEFEGVYHNAEVLINGQQAAFRPYGYTNFYVDANPYLKYGETNRIGGHCPQRGPAQQQMVLRSRNLSAGVSVSR